MLTVMDIVEATGLSRRAIEKKQILDGYCLLTNYFFILNILII